LATTSITFGVANIAVAVTLATELGSLDSSAVAGEEGILVVTTSVRKMKCFTCPPIIC
jgi:hypothetical protein